MVMIEGRRERTCPPQRTKLRSSVMTVTEMLGADRKEKNCLSTPRKSAWPPLARLR